MTSQPKIIRRKWNWGGGGGQIVSMNPKNHFFLNQFLVTMLLDISCSFLKQQVSKLPSVVCGIQATCSKLVIFSL